MFTYFFAIVVFLILCFILCATILIQDSKSSGLGSSFGGDSNDSLFGTSTAEVVKRFTAWLGGAFLVFCLVLSFWTSGLAKGHMKQESEEPLEIEQLDKNIPL